MWPLLRTITSCKLHGHAHIAGDLIILTPDVALSVGVFLGAVPLDGSQPLLRQRVGDDDVKLAVVDHHTISSVQDCSHHRLRRVHHVREQEGLDDAAVVEGLVSDVDGLPRGRKGQVLVVRDGFVGVHGVEVVEVVVEAGDVLVVSRVRSLVTVQDNIPCLQI